MNFKYTLLLLSLACGPAHCMENQLSSLQKLCTNIEKLPDAKLPLKISAKDTNPDIPVSIQELLTGFQALEKLSKNKLTAEERTTMKEIDTALLNAFANHREYKSTITDIEDNELREKILDNNSSHKKEDITVNHILEAIDNYTVPLLY